MDFIHHLSAHLSGHVIFASSIFNLRNLRIKSWNPVCIRGIWWELKGVKKSPSKFVPTGSSRNIHRFRTIDYYLKVLKGLPQNLFLPGRKPKYPQNSDDRLLFIWFWQTFFPAVSFQPFSFLYEGGSFCLPAILFYWNEINRFFHYFTFLAVTYYIFHWSWSFITDWYY